MQPERFQRSELELESTVSTYAAYIYDIRDRLMQYSRVSRLDLLFPSSDTVMLTGAVADFI